MNWNSIKKKNVKNPKLNLDTMLNKLFNLITVTFMYNTSNIVEIFF